MPAVTASVRGRSTNAIDEQHEQRDARREADDGRVIAEAGGKERDRREVPARGPRVWLQTRSDSSTPATIAAFSV